MAIARRCRLGFVGCGRLNNQQHIQNASKSGVCLVHTLCDIDQKRLSETASKYPPVKTTTDYREMLADPEVDAVVVAMTPAMQARVALDAVSAGKHVYVEKPLGETLDDALEIERAARAAGLTVATGFNRRFAPAYRDLKPRLAARRRGSVIYYRIADPYDREPDRIHIEVCHVFDALRWLLDSDPVKVWAARSNYYQDSVVNLIFDEGSVASIGASSQGNEMIPKEHLEAMWDGTAVTIEDFTEARYFSDDPSMPPLVRYKGLTYDGCGDASYAQRFVTVGYEAVLAERRLKHEAELQAAAGGHPSEQLLRRPFNYMVDKGWKEALDAFSVAVISGEPTDAASAIDAAWATLLTEVANESINSGQTVDVDTARLKL